MATIITEHINDSSSFGVKITLKDTNGVDVVDSAITSISWTWTTSLGGIINSRKDIAETVTNPIIIKLNSDDTDFYEETDEVTRLLTVKWVYTDANLGANSVHVEEYQITGDNFKNV